MPSKPKSLPFSEIEKRLRKIGYELAQVEEGVLVFWQLRPPYFPYGAARRIAYPFPAYYREWDLVPAGLVEEIIRHLFLSGDEDEQFWNDEPTVH